MEGQALMERHNFLLTEVMAARVARPAGEHCLRVAPPPWSIAHWPGTGLMAQAVAAGEPAQRSFLMAAHFMGAAETVPAAVPDGEELLKKSPGRCELQIVRLP